MTWNVSAEVSGSYEAIVHYTCPEADIGSAIELSLGGTVWRGTIAEPFDPPLRGMENDRVKRGSESYVKTFRPLSLGVQNVDRGVSTLRLKASRVAGQRVADVRSVELRLIESSQ